MAKHKPLEVVDWLGVGIRDAGHTYQHTDEQKEEWVKCALDPIYFIEKYWKIIHPDRGLILFPLRPFQKLAVEAYTKERKIAMLCSRQIGKTSVTAAWIGWFIIFHNNVSVGVLADKQETAVEIHDRIKTGYENIPHWLKHGKVKWNVKSIKLENGSSIQVSATTINAGRGRAFSVVFLDEFAAVARKIAEKFKASIIPTISSGTETKLFITSTPQGKNHFYKIVKEAEAGNNWRLIKADYRADPNRNNPEWVAEQIKELGIDQFRQEHECSFLGSTQTLIHPDKLRALVPQKPIKVSPLNIYQNPVENHQYMMWLDCAEGVGLDYSSIQVIDVSTEKFNQVAAYHDNTIKPNEFAILAKQIGKMYNDAMIFIEDESTGPIVAEDLSTLEYTNMLSLEKIKNKDKYKVVIGRNGKGRFGGKATAQFKLLGCSELKRLIETDNLIINDKQTIEELESYSRSGIGYAAEEGNNDDLVTALVSFGRLHNIKEFRQMLESAKLSAEQIKQKADNLQILNFLQRGRNDGSFVSNGVLWNKIGGD